MVAMGVRFDLHPMCHWFVGAKVMGETFYPRLSMPLACRALDDVYGGLRFSLAMDHFGWT